MFFGAFVIVFLAVWGLVYATMPAGRGLLSFAARTVVRNARGAKLGGTHGHQLRRYWPGVAPLVAGGAPTAWGGGGFLGLAVMVHDKSGGVQEAHQPGH